jgi:hypothetical protein
MQQMLLVVVAKNQRQHIKGRIQQKRCDSVTNWLINWLIVQHYCATLFNKHEQHRCGCHIFTLH